MRGKKDEMDVEKRAGFVGMRGKKGEFLDQAYRQYMPFKMRYQSST